MSSNKSKKLEGKFRGHMLSSSGDHELCAPPSPVIDTDGRDGGGRRDGDEKYSGGSGGGNCGYGRGGEKYGGRGGSEDGGKNGGGVVASELKMMVAGVVAMAMAVKSIVVGVLAKAMAVKCMVTEVLAMAVKSMVARAVDMMAAAAELQLWLF
ncbi:RNA helicase [Bertholletia excelsa]